MLWRGDIFHLSILGSAVYSGVFLWVIFHSSLPLAFSSITGFVPSHILFAHFHMLQTFTIGVVTSALYLFVSMGLVFSGGDIYLMVFVRTFCLYLYIA